MPEQKSPWDELMVTSDGVVCLRPCRDIVFYWVGSVFERVAGILDFYRRSLDLLRPRATFFRTETMRAAQRLRKDSLELVPFWLEETKTRRETYMLYLESGRVADEPSDTALYLQALEYGATAKGYIRLVMPVELVGEPDGAFVELAARLSNGLGFAFGQAGYSVNWNDLGHYQLEAMNGMRKIGVRHPGIDLSYPLTTQFAVEKGGIKSVNWLTFLNAEHVARLGGIGQLKEQLGQDIPVRSVSDGVMIQAGPRPEIGDVNRRLDLPFYRRVGKILAPVRAKDHPAFLGRDGLPSVEITQKWLSRFDR